MTSYVGVYNVNLIYMWSGPSTSIKTFSFTVVDPCILNNVPPVTLPDYTAYIGDPNFLQGIALTVGLPYQDYCIYSVSLISTKTTTPDTSPAAVGFTDMVNRLYTDLGLALITYHVSIQDLANVGIYNLVVTYQWGGTGTATSALVPFVLTLKDPC